MSLKKKAGPGSGGGGGGHHGGGGAGAGEAGWQKQLQGLRQAFTVASAGAAQNIIFASEVGAHPPPARARARRALIRSAHPPLESGEG